MIFYVSILFKFLLDSPGLSLASRFLTVFVGAWRLFGKLSDGGIALNMLRLTVGVSDFSVSYAANHLIFRHLLVNLARSVLFGMFFAFLYLRVHRTHSTLEAGLQRIPRSLVAPTRGLCGFFGE